MAWIVFDARKIRDYGVGTHIQGLLPALVRQAPPSLRWLVLAPPGARSLLASLLPDRGPAVRVLWTRARPFGLGTHIEIPWRLRNQVEGPCVFHAPYFPLPIALPCPAVLTLHDAILLEVWPRPAGAWIARLARRLIAWSAERAACVVTVSQTAARQILHHFPWLADKVHVIPNGVHPVFWTPVAADEVERRCRALGLSPGEYLLYVGNDKPHKNLPRLIETCIELWRQRAISHRLVLAGMPLAAWRRVVRRYYSWTQLGWVRWLPYGDVETLRTVYAGAVALVQPSLDEGFGLPVVEAMAVGTPVVCSRAGALPEVAGDAAVYFDPTDPADMARAILQTLTDESLRAACRERGRRRAAQFRWEDAAERFLELYDRLGVPRPVPGTGPTR
jgi:glycosyltransferase involved in cell wall biosynthesis